MWARAVAPDQADAASQRRGEVVGVALERQPELEQLVGGELLARERRSRDEPGGDRRGRRAEPAFERDPVDEPEPVAAGRSDLREGAEREVVGVARHLVGSLALDDDVALVALLDVELVPELERRGRTVEPGPEVGGRSRRANDEGHLATSARMASTVGSTTIVAGVRTSIADVSLRPWPVRMHTTVLPGSSEACARPARPAADDGSQKRPSR